MDTGRELFYLSGRSSVSVCVFLLKSILCDILGNWFCLLCILFLLFSWRFSHVSFRQHWVGFNFLYSLGINTFLFLNKGFWLIWKMKFGIKNVMILYVKQKTSKLTVCHYLLKCVFCFFSKRKKNLQQTKLGTMKPRALINRPLVHPLTLAGTMAWMMLAF